MIRVAPKRWDKVYMDFKGNRFSIWRFDATTFLKEKIPYLKEHGVKKILDAGCGDGRNLLRFAEAGFEMVGMDYSTEACKLAERVVSQYPATKIICQDLSKLEGNVKYDAIICDSVMVHLPNGQQIIDNFYKALKKGGYLLIDCLSTDDPSFGNGEQIGKNAFIDHGVSHQFYSMDDIKGLLTSFEILETQKVSYEDPDHVADYPRPKKHQHDSIYILSVK